MRAAVSFTGDHVQTPWMLWSLIAVFLACLFWFLVKSTILDDNDGQAFHD